MLWQQFPLRALEPLSTRPLARSVDSCPLHLGYMPVVGESKGTGEPVAKLPSLRLWSDGTHATEGAVGFLRDTSGSVEFKRNRCARWGETSQNRKTGLQTRRAEHQGGRDKTRRAYAPTADVCGPAWPRRLETRHNRAAGPGPPRTPAASAWQTRPTEAARPVRSYAQNDNPGFAAY